MGLLSAAISRPASAQDFGYIDANGLPAPGPTAPFVGVPSPSSLDAGTFAAALRSSVLLEPISGSQPSPDPNGTATSVVSFLWLQEVMLGVGIGAGIDLSLALPVHLPQAGQGLTGVGIGDALAPVALGDLRFGAGIEIPLGSWALRPQGVVYIPIGAEQEFAGERLPRGDLSVAAAWSADAWMLGGSLGVRVRETSELSNLRWSPQLLLALAARYSWSQNVDTSLELTLAPTLGGQPEAASGGAGFLFPAEVLLGGHYRADPLIFGLLCGSGLPLSVARETGALVRGPTSPTLRLGFEIGTTF